MSELVKHDRLARLLSAALLAMLLLRFTAANNYAQVPPPDDSPPVVAASVNEQPIFVHEVDREIARVLRGRNIEPEAKTFLQAQALQQLIDRQLILEWLQQHQRAATDQDVEHAITQLTKQLGKREIALADYLKQRRMKATELHRALRWQLSWQRFLDRFRTDQNLERYFNEHRAQFDGTELRVAHILLKVDPSDARDELALQLVKARRIRAEIVTDKKRFAEAARQFSDAPTGAAGGDIGFISRHAPMPEPFSEAAFQLQPGDVSEPLVSAFGVHLIQCLEVKPGQKRWQEVRSQLEQAVTQYLFEWAARKVTDAQIEFTEAAPHFKPGTHEVEYRQ